MNNLYIVLLMLSIYPLNLIRKAWLINKIQKKLEKVKSVLDIYFDEDFKFEDTLQYLVFSEMLKDAKAGRILFFVPSVSNYVWKNRV